MRGQSLFSQEDLNAVIERSRVEQTREDLEILAATEVSQIETNHFDPHFDAILERSRLEQSREDFEIKAAVEASMTDNELTRALHASMTETRIEDSILEEQELLHALALSASMNNGIPGSLKSSGASLRKDAGVGSDRSDSSSPPRSQCEPLKRGHSFGSNPSGSSSARRQLKKSASGASFGSNPSGSSSVRRQLKKGASGASFGSDDQPSSSSQMNVEAPKQKSSDSSAAEASGSNVVVRKSGSFSDNSAPSSGKDAALGAMEPEPGKRSAPGGPKEPAK